ncbi:MFS transporter [Paenibacillus sacheonensis]|uniref:MFS transporter n=1 Tax=Paenibacillus sacheonensis TaxID=742054 RepID=A0A7X4YQ98_9BACL|nr:MFS transporter [Paenibacillus sacheonensis]MBM7566349.1 putative MFS transporter [Paenibacillus sacheonensis]NBC70552.1 MFS transporter [Paenibacillus sacheonensis]
MSQINAAAAGSKRELRKVFWAAGFGWMFDAMDVGLLSFILVALRKEWGLSAREAGLLGTVNLVGMAIGAVLGGYLADRFGRRPVFLLTLVVFGAFSFGSAFASGFVLMLLLRFLMGVGLGAELPVASTLVSEFSPPEARGRTVVLLESFWAVGWILAAVLAYFVIPPYGWRIAVAVGALPILLAFWIRREVKESPQFRRQKQERRIRIRELFTSYKRETIALWAVWFAIAFSYYGMFLWLPSVLVDKGFSMIQSFRYVLIMTLAQLPGYFVASYLVEKWGRKATLAVFLVFSGAMALGFGSSDSTAVLLVTGALLSFSNLGAWGALYAYTPENYPAAIRAAGSGFAAGFGRLGSVAAPYLVGVLVQADIGYASIFGVFAAVLLIGTVMLLLYGVETKTRRSD